MIPSEQHIQTLTKFNQWTKSLFGKASPCFSSKFHKELNGNFTINRGQMLIEFGEKTIRLIDKARGANIVVCHGVMTLEEALMSGLTWAIRQKFCDTYIQ